MLGLKLNHISKRGPHKEKWVLINIKSALPIEFDVGTGIIFIWRMTMKSSQNFTYIFETLVIYFAYLTVFYHYHISWWLLFFCVPQWNNVGLGQVIIIVTLCFQPGYSVMFRSHSKPDYFGSWYYTVNIHLINFKIGKNRSFRYFKVWMNSGHTHWYQI